MTTFILRDICRKNMILALFQGISNVLIMHATDTDDDGRVHLIMDIGMLVEVVGKRIISNRDLEGASIDVEYEYHDQGHYVTKIYAIRFVLDDVIRKAFEHMDDEN